MQNYSPEYNDKNILERLKKLYGDRYIEILWRLKDEKKNKILIKN